MQSRLNTFFASSSGTFGAARPCLASDNNADDDALDAMWQSMLDDIDKNGIAGIAGCGNSCNKSDFYNELLETNHPGFEATHNVSSGSSTKIQLVGECVQAVEVCNIQCDGGHTQVVPPTEHTIFMTH